MLGEGFDLPALKVAAIHDPQRSLGVSLQFIGRFARTTGEGNIGDASMFVARSDYEVDRRLRTLYAEDADWNLILRDLTESAVEFEQEKSEFLDGFTSAPDEVNLRNLLPKMSTVAYSAPSDQWDPMAVVDFFGEERFLTNPIGLNHDAGVAWFVVEFRQDVRWGDLKTIEEVSFQLFVLFFDAKRKILYINNSANDGLFEDLANAVIGPGAQRFTGSSVYRVMSDIDRLVPTNVGVLDAHDHFRRFSMHVGSDVTEGFTQAEAGTKSQTNISGGGYRGGEYISIGASLKGRIWSHAAASSVKEWRDWCEALGEKLLDETISIDSVIGQFILPEVLSERPEGILLCVEWPWEIHLLQAENFQLSVGSSAFRYTEVDFICDTSSITGPLKFAIQTPDWISNCEAYWEDNRMKYRCLDSDVVKVQKSRSEEALSDWLNQNGLIFILDDDRIIENDLLYKPNWNKPPYDPSKLTPIDWTGVNLRVESQTPQRLTHSIQNRAIEVLRAQPHEWDVILDDDGCGEIADIVAMRIDSEGLLICLVHCKFSHGDDPGARVDDLYEVCGQAQKSVMWRRDDLRTFFRTLIQRARRKQERDGVSPFELGDFKLLMGVHDRALIHRRRMEIVIAQPGLSISKATTKQLDLLSSTESYLRTTINAPLHVWCSN